MLHGPRDNERIVLAAVQQDLAVDWFGHSGDRFSAGGYNIN